MLDFPAINPVAIQIFGFSFHWYGLMYVLAFATSYVLARIRVNKTGSGWTMEQVSDLLFYSMIGVIVGGRIGYFLFYIDPEYWFSPPWQLLLINNGGMSFHGGALGVIAGIWFFARRHSKSFLQVGDFVAPLVPLGLGFGRIGNFINGELWGRVVSAEFPLGMVFPTGGPLPRHPSQLYQAALEGLVLFIILWWYSSKPKPSGSTGALFLLCYGIARFCVEFVRQPDAHLQFVAFDWMTMGHVLSLPMIAIGLGLFAYCWLRHGQANQQL